MFQKKERIKMKKYLILLLLGFAGVIHTSPQKIFSRSFMFTRPASFNIEMDMQLWHNFVYSKKGSFGGAFQAIGFYQKSIDRTKTAKYFLINDKCQLTVAGDSVTDLFFTRDIRAEWLDLPDTFQGKLSLCPEQRQAGVKLFYNQDLKDFGISFFEDWSIGIEMPILWVENNINFVECDVVTTATTLCEAFNNDDWCFARIPCCKQSKTRPANIKLTAGRDFPMGDCCQFASFLSLEIPIGDHQDPKFLFSPVVGNDRHVGLGGAVLMQFQLNKNPEKVAFSFFIDLEGMFLIRNHQFRTYDLKDKPWSRYLKFVRKNGSPGQTVPGVNVLTLESIVRPFGIADFSTGWRIKTKKFELELGYDLWGHGGETVKLRDAPVTSPFNICGGGLNEFGIAGSGTIMEKGMAVAATASESTISCQADDDSAFVGITDNDLDFCTPATGSALNHKIHAAAGLQHDGEGVGGFIGLGGFVEFAQKNSPLSTWGIWAKVGASF